MKQEHNTFVLSLVGDRYVLKRQLLKVFERGFGVYDESNRLVLQCDESLSSLRGRVVVRESGYGKSDALGIFATSLLEFAATYDVVDLTQGVKIGAIQRRWIRSLVQDEWGVLDVLNREIGIVREDRLGLALLRRCGASLIPQRYELSLGARNAVAFRQNFNPLTYHLGIEFLLPPVAFDRRLGIAAAVLLGAVEGRQASILGPISDVARIALPF